MGPWNIKHFILGLNIFGGLGLGTRVMHISYSSWTFEFILDDDGLHPNPVDNAGLLFDNNLQQ